MIKKQGAGRTMFWSPSQLGGFLVSSAAHMMFAHTLEWCRKWGFNHGGERDTVVSRQHTASPDMLIDLFFTLPVQGSMCSYRSYYSYSSTVLKHGFKVLFLEYFNFLLLWTFKIYFDNCGFIRSQMRNKQHIISEVCRRLGPRMNSKIS